MNLSALQRFNTAVRDNDDRGVDDLMQEIDHLFVHSTTDANVQS